MASNEKKSAPDHIKNTSVTAASNVKNTSFSDDLFESPTDLLYRILGHPLIFNAEGGPLPKSPYLIPVLTQRQYYSLTKVERADYHLLQHVFNGKIELPKLHDIPSSRQPPVSRINMEDVIAICEHDRGAGSGNQSGNAGGVNPRMEELINIVTKSIEEKRGEVDDDHDLPKPKLQSTSSGSSSMYGEDDDGSRFGSEHGSDGVVIKPGKEVYEDFAKGNPFAGGSNADLKK